MKTVSSARRQLAQGLLLATAAPRIACAQPQSGVPKPKTLRYAFRVAETGFDPAQVNDLYSSNDRVEIYIVEENQPRWLAFLNREHDLVDELPYDLADIASPNERLAPGLVRRCIRMDRAPRASVDMALFGMEYPVVGGDGTRA